MAERYLLTRRRPAAATTALESVDFAAEPDLGALKAEIQNATPAVTVERLSPTGAVARVATSIETEEEPRAALERSGYRVKRLPETDLIRVGAYAVNTGEGPAESGLETFEPAAEEASADPSVPPDLTVPQDQAATWPHHLVQLIAPPTPEWVARIEEQGVEVVEPISRYALFVCALPERVRALRGLKLPQDGPEAQTFVVWTGPFQPAYRLSPEVRTLLGTTGTVRYLRIGVSPESRAEIVKGSLESWGGRVVEQWQETGKYHDRIAILLAELDASDIPRLARLPDVRLIERQEPSMKPDDERSAQIIAQALQGDPPETEPTPGYTQALTRFGLSGDGVLLGICDTGIDTNQDSTLHPDLSGRLAFFDDVTGGSAPTDTNGHGTHVAGIAAGNSASGEVEPGAWSLGQGIAPRARFGIINPVDTPGSPGLKPVGDFTRALVGHGVHVMNNSWRNGTGSGYSAGCALVDRLVRDPNGDGGSDPARSYLVLVFSAGNSGPSASTVTEPKEAKNPIIVGNSRNRRATEDDIRGVWDSSSRGPALDGRILPTVVAPGGRIVSARSASSARPAFQDDGGTVHDHHTEMTGTSMAAPHVSGVCALLIEWWRRRNGQNALPSPALLKALLVNAAEDLAGGPDGRPEGTLTHIPNNDQGWGWVCLRNMVMDHPGSDRGPRLFFDQDAASALTAAGGERLISVRAVRPGAPLRVTLAWTDPPGAPNASPALVNDLDLEVTEVVVGGPPAIFKGNVFRDGFSVPGEGDFDTLNNVECVYVRAARAEALYEVRVIAGSLTGDARSPFQGSAFQDFALVIDNAKEVVPPG